MRESRETALVQQETPTKMNEARRDPRRRRRTFRHQKTSLAGCVVTVREHQAAHSTHLYLPRAQLTSIWVSCCSKIEVTQALGPCVKMGCWSVPEVDRLSELHFLHLVVEKLASGLCDLF